MYSKIGYAIKTEDGVYLWVEKDRLGLDIEEQDTPEGALIWDKQEAEDIRFHAQQQIGKKCHLVAFELTEMESL